MNHLVIIRGLPGSGKSSLADRIVLHFVPENKHEFFIHSTDNYWVRKDNYYDFNGDLLGRAHQWNFDCFEDTAIDIKGDFSKSAPEKNWVEFTPLDNHIHIIDNTNIKWKDFKNYVKFAVEHGYTWEALEANTEWRYDVDTLFEKNTHRVPKEVIQTMLDKWRSTDDILKDLPQELLDNYAQKIELGD